jgi:hypothetical protein
VQAAKLKQAEGAPVRANAESSSHRVGDRKAVEPEVCLYRGRTVAILRKYLRMSVELGRVPSLLGREFFRARVTSYRMSTFEDAVIMAYDIDRCLNKLALFDQQLIAVVILQEYSHDEAAEVLGCHRVTVTNGIRDALDTLSAEFLRVGILESMD